MDVACCDEDHGGASPDATHDHFEANHTRGSVLPSNAAVGVRPVLGKFDTHLLCPAGPTHGYASDRQTRRWVQRSRSPERRAAAQDKRCVSIGTKSTTALSVSLRKGRALRRRRFGRPANDHGLGAHGCLDAGILSSGAPRRDTSAGSTVARHAKAPDSIPIRPSCARPKTLPQCGSLLMSTGLVFRDKTPFRLALPGQLRRAACNENEET